MKLVLLRMPAFGGQCPPLNLACLSAYLKARGHHVDLIDLDAETCRAAAPGLRESFWSDSFLARKEAWADAGKRAALLSAPLLDAWQARVLELAPDIVGFSIYSLNFYPSVHLARRLKEASAVKTVFGGPFCLRENGIAEAAVREGFADAAVVGEGEETLAELVEDFASGTVRKSPGAIRRNGQAIEDGGPRALIRDLDALPYPDFSGLRMDDYENFAVAASRGCINKCAFCADHSLIGGYRYRGAAGVVAEIGARIRAHGKYKFMFLDVLINGDLAELERMCRLLIKLQAGLGKRIEWWAFAFPRRMSAALVGLMKRAGCRRLSIGVESGSPRLLRLYNRSADLAAAEDFIRACHAEGILVRIDWMVGFPGETDEDFELTLALARKLLPYTREPEFRPASICAVIPGSNLWSDPHRYGITERASGSPQDLPGPKDPAPSAEQLRRRAVLNDIIKGYREQNPVEDRSPGI